MMSRLILNVSRRERVKEMLRELVTLPESVFNMNTLEALEALLRSIKKTE
jgi:hypothetical protein